MITREEALYIHEESVIVFGGSHGIRDEAGLDAALARPYSGFGDDLFYLGPFEQAAAILESIIMNHPFVDGNKRTDFLLSFAILERANIELTKDLELSYEFVVKVATGEYRFEEAVEWLRNNSKVQ